MATISRPPATVNGVAAVFSRHPTAESGGVAATIGGAAASDEVTATISGMAVASGGAATKSSRTSTTVSGRDYKCGDLDGDEWPA